MESVNSCCWSACLDNSKCPVNQWLFSKKPFGWNVFRQFQSLSGRAPARVHLFPIPFNWWAMICCSSRQSLRAVFSKLLCTSMFEKYFDHAGSIVDINPIFVKHDEWEEAVVMKCSSESRSTFSQTFTFDSRRQDQAGTQNLLQLQRSSNKGSRDLGLKPASSPAKQNQIQKPSWQQLRNIKPKSTGAVPRPKSFPEALIDWNVCLMRTIYYFQTLQQTVSASSPKVFIALQMLRGQWIRFVTAGNPMAD